MPSPDSDIHDFDVCNLINKLIRFIGRNNINNSLEKYRNSLSMSGPVYREYFLKNRHPWWKGFEEYLDLERSGKSVRRNATPAIKRLAGDAKKISILQRDMPSVIRDKYKRDLIDKERAFDFLFEIDMAWHYHIKGHKIVWYTERNKPEFLVVTKEFDFNVECKRVTVDAFRKIRRRDFYRLIERLLPDIHNRNFQGTIDIVLKQRLSGGDHHLKILASQIYGLVAAGKIKGEFVIPLGRVYINLEVMSDCPIDFDARVRQMMDRLSPQAHGAVFAKNENEVPVSSVEFTIKSEKANEVLKGIKRKIKEAATSQLCEEKPGIITCFLEGIEELDSLSSASGLQAMSHDLLFKQELSHIAAISYCSEERLYKKGNVEDYHSQGLLFRNPNCKFKELRNFQFLSDEVRQ